MEEPKSASDVRTFLGLANHSSRFIPHFAALSEPLRRLTRKETPFELKPEQKKSFEILKQKMAEACTLAYFHKNAPTKIITDASPVGLGAVLVQEQNGAWTPVCYASRSLTGCEQRYSQTEKEALGVVWACERFHVYVYGMKFIIVFSSSYRPRPALKNLVIASDTVDCSTTGVIFNNSLSMLPHVTAVCKSSFFHLRNIFKIRKFLSYDTCKTLIHAFVTAKIDYCNSLLFGQPKCILKRLQSVLNSAARLIHLTSRYGHVTPLLIQLHWLPIEQRITFKIAVITFKALHVAAPSYITDLIKPYTPGRLLRSSNQFLLSTSKFNLKTYGGRSFTISAPSVWNALPFELI